MALKELRFFHKYGYREDRVLIMEGKTPATWREYEFLMPDHIIGNRKTASDAAGCIIRGSGRNWF